MVLSYLGEGGLPANPAICHQPAKMTFPQPAYRQEHN